MFYFSAVFTWTNLLVVVAELDGNENEALDLVPLVTNVVLEVSQTVRAHLLSELVPSVQQGTAVSEVKKRKMKGFRQELDTMDTPMTELNVSHQVCEHL